METLTESTTEQYVRSRVDVCDRNAIIKAIKTALEKRSGKKWSVTGGKGTAWGWITIDAPPARRTAHCKLKVGALSTRPEDYEEVNTGEPNGYTTKEDRIELAGLLGKDISMQGDNIPAGSDYRREYLHRALYGNPGSFNAKPYWD